MKKFSHSVRYDSEKIIPSYKNRNGFLVESIRNIDKSGTIPYNLKLVFRYIIMAFCVTATVMNQFCELSVFGYKNQTRKR